jgi:hypothetical protein
MDFIPHEFSLSQFETEKDERLLLKMIQDRVDELMAYDLELLMSYLYRMDVAEKDIQNVIHFQNEVPANEGLAQLIFERQLKRLETRKKYQQKPIEGWEF